MTGKRGGCRERRLQGGVYTGRYTPGSAQWSILPYTPVTPGTPCTPLACCTAGIMTEHDIVGQERGSGL